MIQTPLEQLPAKTPTHFEHKRVCVVSVWMVVE